MRSTLSGNSGTVSMQFGNISVQVQNSGSKQEIIEEAMQQFAELLNDALDDDMINAAIAQP